ncbi:hypothetical protein J5638_00645 [Enterobacter roggenkampii]|uniref:hypothetical protein n=1 Tax=Enterobacter TaxID=547 RepID=UPI001ABDF474|nr:hypothetical protein [Enterobacter roggenkampii]MBO4170935.1 hypothetical protein [Enterobacter roggenkampii]HDR2337871.1 hypothetical protein [Enterobacter roggenkampii]
MIFNGEMVRAILDGRKTQTRRIMKVQPDTPEFGLRRIIESSIANEIGMYFWSQEDARGIKARSKQFSCPFGDVGDRIWVRETWAEAGAGAPDLKLYRANYPEHVPTHYENVPPVDEIRWTPSIHMPRWASRLTLEITGVRVERLDKISEEDAISEGMQGVICPSCKGDPDYSTTQYDPDSLAAVDEIPCQSCESNRSKFFALWDSIYGEANHCMGDWVWVIEFKVVPNVQDNPA